MESEEVLSRGEQAVPDLLRLLLLQLQGEKDIGRAQGKLVKCVSEHFTNSYPWQMPVLYHYTNKAGRDGIMRSKKIKMSMKHVIPADVTFGEGVYLTEKEPSSGKNAILRNNYDDVWQQMKKKGLADYGIKITFPAKHPKLSQMSRSPNRDVWLFEGDLDLGEFPHEADVVTAP